MDVSKTIRERRTIRRFSAKPVVQDQIVSILKEAAGLYEAEGTPHWRCLYFSSSDAREQLADSMIAKIKESSIGRLLPGKMTEYIKKQATAVSAHVVFIAEAAETRHQRNLNYAAVCSVMQNVQLLGWEQGLGMVWYTDPMIHSDVFFKTIGLREGEQFAGILEIGYVEKTPKARKRTPAEQNWSVIGPENGALFSKFKSSSYPSPHTILELLNEAVWAPNDGMREPWRFIYVTEVAAAKRTTPGTATNNLYSARADRVTPPFLLVVAKEEANSHKQQEDYAAVCCLIQNMQLLAKSRSWPIRRSIPQWGYDPEQRQSYGLRPLERIVAVLELGGEKRNPRTNLSPSDIHMVIY